MDNWIVAISFTYPHEAHFATAKLESEGIETKIKDELTAQVNNFYSNAIGGVKVQVKEQDYHRTIKILEECHFIIPDKNKENDLAGKSNKNLFAAKSIFFISILIAIVAFVIVVIAVFSLPSTKEKLTSYQWCWNTMYYEDYEITPSTKQMEIGTLKFTILDECAEFIIFQQNDIIQLPGFNTTPLLARWKIENDKIIIFPLNGDMSLVNNINKEKWLTSEAPDVEVYYGIYTIKFQSINLILESKKSKIYIYR